MPAPSWMQEEDAIALVEAMLDANALELLVQVRCNRPGTSRCRRHAHMYEHHQMEDVAAHAARQL